MSIGLICICFSECFLTPLKVTEYVFSFLMFKNVHTNERSGYIPKWAILRVCRHSSLCECRRHQSCLIFFKRSGYFLCCNQNVGNASLLCKLWMKRNPLPRNPLPEVRESSPHALCLSSYFCLISQSAFSAVPLWASAQSLLKTLEVCDLTGKAIFTWLKTISRS